MLLIPLHINRSERRSDRDCSQSDIALFKVKHSGRNQIIVSNRVKFKHTAILYSIH